MTSNKSGVVYSSFQFLHGNRGLRGKTQHKKDKKTFKMAKTKNWRISELCGISLTGCLQRSEYDGLKGSGPVSVSASLLFPYHENT